MNEWKSSEWVSEWSSAIRVPPKAHGMTIVIHELKMGVENNIFVRLMTHRTGRNNLNSRVLLSSDLLILIFLSNTYLNQISNFFLSTVVRSPYFIPSPCFIPSPYFPVRVLYLVRIYTQYAVRSPQSAVYILYWPIYFSSHKRVGVALEATV